MFVCLCIVCLICGTAALPTTNYLQFRATRDWSDGDAFSDAKARKYLESTFSADERAKGLIAAAAPNWDVTIDCQNELFVAIRALTTDLGVISAVHLPVLNLIGQYLITTNITSDPRDPRDAGDAGDAGDATADVEMTEPAPTTTKGRKKTAKSKSKAAAAAAATAAPAPAPVPTPARYGEGGYFQVRAKPSVSAIPVSKWISAGCVNTDSCSLGVFDIPVSHSALATPHTHIRQPIVIPSRACSIITNKCDL